MTLSVRNPRTGEDDYAIRPLNAGEVGAVAAKLREAQPRWAALPAGERGVLLHRWADAVQAEEDAIAAALTLDTGRRAISRIEVAGAVGTIRRWARAAPDLLTREAARGGPTAVPGIATATRLHPYPLVGCVTPWNFPLTLALIDAVPALAAGCAALVKPSEVTPRFVGPLLAAIARVPEVAAVLALVEGDGATGAAVVDAADYVCFTGSVATGRRVAAAAAARMIPASLELGGKDPMIVLASADPVHAAAVALRSSVVNTGQACQSIERVYVADAIADAFTDALVAGAQAARLNFPHIGSGEIGPFIFAPQAAIVATQIADAREKGARILAGGEVERLGGGLYLRATVIADVTPDMAIMTEETFGPVIPVTRFGDVDEAVALANGGGFGLSAAVLAGSVDEAEAVAARLHAGAVSINDGALTSMIWEAEKSSFGASGLGPSRMGESGLLRFLRRQALIRQEGKPLPLAAYAEETLP